jgi:hypothetical protein
VLTPLLCSTDSALILSAHASSEHLVGGYGAENVDGLVPRLSR